MERGIRVNGRLYPIPSSLTIGETRQIKRLTGLNPSGFRDAVARLEVEDDPDVSLALIWWCVHRENPTVRVEDLETIEWENVTAEAGDEEEAVVPTPPPSLEADASSPSSSDKSNGSPGVESDPILEGSGARG